MEKYNEAVTWLHDSLFRGVASAERLQVALSALLSSADEEARDIDSIERSWLQKLLFDRNCVASKCSLARQTKFLKKFQGLLDKNPRKAEAKFAAFLSSLREAARHHPIVHIEGDMRRVPSPHTPWQVWPFVKKSDPLRLPSPSSRYLRRKLQFGTKVLFFYKNICVAFLLISCY